MKLIALGDSITYGYGIHPSQKWTTLLSQSCHIDVENHGINGDTTGGMLARLQQILAPYRSDSSLSTQGHVVLVMGGGNDIFYSNSSSEAKNNIGAMVNQIANLGLHPMVGIAPAMVPQDIPSSWGTVVQFDRAVIAMAHFDGWQREFCTSFDVDFVDFSGDFLSPEGQPKRHLFLDGIHPNEEGQQLMAQQMQQQLHRLHLLNG